MPCDRVDGRGVHQGAVDVEQHGAHGRPVRRHTLLLLGLLLGLLLVPGTRAVPRRLAGNHGDEVWSLSQAGTGVDMTDQGDRPATPTSGRLLAIYLRHHAAASKGGLDLFERAGRQQTSPEARRELRQLAAEIAEDRSALLGFLDVLGVPRPRLGERIMGWGEKLGRLKPNGTLIRRSPLSDIVELEALGVAVQAKKSGWLTLRRLAETDHRLDVAQLDELVRRATDQQDRIEDLRRQAVSGTLVPRGAPR